MPPVLKIQRALTDTVEDYVNEYSQTPPNRNETCYTRSLKRENVCDIIYMRPGQKV